jgi:tRNA (guanine10-N2)-methyltransferase
MIMANRLSLRAVYELYAQGSSYSSLHAANVRNRPLWERYTDDTSFRFLVTAYQHKIPKARQKEVIEASRTWASQAKLI